MSVLYYADITIINCERPQMYCGVEKGRLWSKASSCFLNFDIASKVSLQITDHSQSSEYRRKETHTYMHMYSEYSSPHIEADVADGVHQPNESK